MVKCLVCSKPPHLRKWKTYNKPLRLKLLTLVRRVPFKWNWVLLKVGPCPITHPPSSHGSLFITRTLALDIEYTCKHAHTHAPHKKYPVKHSHALLCSYTHMHTAQHALIRSEQEKRNWVYIFSPKGSQEWHFHSPKLLFFKRGRETHTMRGRESKRLCFISGSA